MCLGLISQVAEELWEVKNKKIRNLSKVCERPLRVLYPFLSTWVPLLMNYPQEDISIVDYKALLAKESVAAIEKAKLFSKSGRSAK
jgi:ATP-binding cassette, subfamily F, member 2